MERLRRPESFEEVRSEGLFRATSVGQILANWGAIFVPDLPGLLVAGGFHASKIPTKQEVLLAGANIFDGTSSVEHVDVFVSHRCGSQSWAKFLAMCLFLNLPVAVVCSLAAWSLAALVLVAASHGDLPSLSHHPVLLPALVFFPMAMFLLAFFLGHHAVHPCEQLRLWLDRACIHQTDQALKIRQIHALPVFVARSSTMLVLWDDEYFQRLWCQLELATFAKHGGVAKVTFLPLWLAPWLLSALAMNLTLVTVIYLQMEVLTTDKLASFLNAVAPARFWQTPFGVFSGAAMGTAVLGLLVALAWSSPFKIKLRSHALMLQQMASFDCRGAQCTEEEDRRLVQRQIRELFRAEATEVMGPEWPEGELKAGHQLTASTVADEDAFSYLPGEPICMMMDERPLDAFNAYVQESLRSCVLDAVGGELHVPYGTCLAAAMPLNFYSLVDILNCTNPECIASYGAESYADFLWASAIGWLTNVLLVFPIVYPIYLRMLKGTLSIQSTCLKGVLTVVSGATAHAYLAVCASGTFILLYQARSAFLLVVLALLLQLQYVFGGGGISGPSVPCDLQPATRPSTDPTYQTLCAENA